MNKIIVIILLAIVTSCHNSENKEPVSQPYNKKHPNREQHRKRLRADHSDKIPENIIYRGDTVLIPEGSPISTRIRTLISKNEKIPVRFITTGIVKPLSGHFAHVTTPFDGRIVRSFIKLGEKVNAGTPLFEVNSSDYLETIRTCIQARQQRELAEKNFQRKKELLESGVISRKEYDETKAELDLAEKECEKTSAILKIYNFDPDKTNMAEPLIVRSPISGEIVQTDITVGQYLRTDDEPIVTIADLQKIWVIARVKEKDIVSIKPNDIAEVYTESYPDNPVRGLVSYIGNIMDENTRSVEVYLECNNDEKLLKPGMFITTRFSRELNNAIVIPSSAVMQDDQYIYVFLKTKNGVFVKRKIEAEANGDSNLIVKSGLSQGDVIVTEGAIYLR